MEDVMMIYNGIKDGIKLGNFTENPMLEILDTIVNKQTVYHIFEDEGQIVGFGGIRDKTEIFKVYVMSNFRGHSYGKRISLWLANKIFRNGIIPICWVKKKNGWNNAQKEMGMELIEKNSYETNMYQLRDLEAYVTAIKKYDVQSIEIKKIEKCVETWEEIHRRLGRT